MASSSSDMKSICLVLAGGFLIHLVNGCMYLWGNIAPYVISYYWHFGGRDGEGQKDVNMYDAVMVTPMITVMLVFMIPTGAFLYRVLSPKILIFMGSLITVASMILSAHTQVFASFVTCYAGLFGVGVGLQYFPPLASGWEWLP